MNSTIFQFGVKLTAPAEDPLEVARAALLPVPGVTGVEIANEMYAWFNITIHVEFKDKDGAHKLHRRVAKTLEAIDGLSITSTSTRPSDFDGPRTTASAGRAVAERKTKADSKSKAGTEKRRTTSNQVPYGLSPKTDTTDVTDMGELEAPPAKIVARFGRPGKGDRYKVSGEFVFVDSNGEPFVVHDWKSTSMWDKSFPRPSEFWASEEPAELTVSSRDHDPDAFIKWFLSEIS